jgi:carbon starvation protein
VQDYIGAVHLDAARGRSMADGPRRLGRSRVAAMSLWSAMVICWRAGTGVVNALAESPWGVFSIAMTIPIAFHGLYLRFLRRDGYPRCLIVWHC